MAKTKAAQPDPPLSRAALLPLALLLVFGLHFVAGWGFAWSVIASMPLVSLFLVAPIWVKGSADAFDRDAVALLASGRPGELDGRYQKALGLRLFGPKAERAARLAMIAAENGDPDRARDEFSRAFDGWEDPKNVPFAVRVGYAHACYETGDYGEAITHYRKVLEERVALPRMRRNLAHALIEEGEALRDALDVLDRADVEASDPEDEAELALLRAWALHAMGQKKKAKRLFKANADVDTDLAKRAREACNA